jgi:hypothetical protein
MLTAHEIGIKSIVDAYEGYYGERFSPGALKFASSVQGCPLVFSSCILVFDYLAAYQFYVQVKWLGMVRLN